MEAISDQALLNSLKFCAVNVVLSDGRSLICTMASKFVRQQSNEPGYVTVAELDLNGKKIGEISFRLNSVTSYFTTKVSNNFYLNSEPYD